MAPAVRSRRRGSGFLGFVGAAAFAVVVGAGAMFVALRLGMLPASLVQQAGVPTGAPLAASLIGAATPTAIAPEPAQGTSAARTPTVERDAGVGQRTPLATPQAAPTAERPRPAAAEAANRFLQAWQQYRYPEMYRMLSASSRQTTAEDRFLTRYQAITLGAGVNSLKTSLAAFAEPPTTAQKVEVGYTVTFQTGRLGEFIDENKLPLVFEGGEWKVDWVPGLIFRELTPDRQVRFFPDDPVRGAILDRNGNPLAAQGKALTLGVIPGRIKDQNLVVTELSKFLGRPPEGIREKIKAAKPDWWVPFKDFPLDRQDDLQKRFQKVDGVLVESKDSRVYPNGAVGEHVIGFVAPATPDDLKTLTARGYEEGDLVGKAGIERGAEEILGGVRGGKLVIQNADGETVRTIAERPAKHGGTVKLSIDLNVQKAAEDVLGDKVGSVVMIDPRDNSILAMVSKPAFDPNGFIFGWSDEDWKKLSEDPRRPFQPRATLSTYATGSVYKVISMAAGLERGGFKPNTMFECNGKWAVLDPLKPMGDWKPQGHGRLDLMQGLVESCDIVFYEIGNKLNQIDPRILPDFTSQFGLGEPTGIQGLLEAEGTVPSPDWKKRTLRQEWFPGDAVNLAIGQGFLDATPLQVANVYSTLANGGMLRTPILIKAIIPGDGGPLQEFQAQEKRRVPVSSQNIAVIRESLKRVASTPRGTALYAFGGYRVPVAAKTGSAENQNPDAHAWFAGYGPATEPTVVVTVMIEGGKSGADQAAPLGRRAFEIVLGK
jgi:penicillin-binding protein 2